MNEFLEMGGYAAFVWPAYGLSLLVLIGLWLHSRLRLARIERRLALFESLFDAERAEAAAAGAADDPGAGDGQ